MSHYVSQISGPPHFVNEFTAGFESLHRYFRPAFSLDVCIYSGSFDASCDALRPDTDDCCVGFCSLRWDLQIQGETIRGLDSELFPQPDSAAQQMRI